MGTFLPALSTTILTISRNGKGTASAVEVFVFYHPEMTCHGLGFLLWKILSRPRVG